jgi:hypothetical protein
MDDGLPEAVPDSLERFKSILDFHPELCAFIDRRGLAEGLAELGLTEMQAKQIIAQDLKAEHHHRGPEPDDHEPDDGIINIFRCPIRGADDAYVKIGLRLTRNKGGQLRGVIWSFKQWQERA